MADRCRDRHRGRPKECDSFVTNANISFGPDPADRLALSLLRLDWRFSEACLPRTVSHFCHLRPILVDASPRSRHSGRFRMVRRHRGRALELGGPAGESGPATAKRIRTSTPSPAGSGPHNPVTPRQPRLHPLFLAPCGKSCCKFVSIARPSRRHGSGDGQGS